MKILALLIICLSAAAGADDYTISGVVVDHLTGQPLNHVLVEINQSGKNGGEAGVLTEADGKFTFLHVPTGKYRLTAQKRGQTPQAFGASEAGFGTGIVVGGGSKTAGIVFPLRTDASITGVISSEDGEPVRGAQVMLFRDGVINGEVQTVRSGTANTNSSGRFHFPHLQKGKYYIAVSARPWFSVHGAETVYPVTFYGDTTDGSAASPIFLKEGEKADAPIVVHSAPGIRVKVPPNIRSNVRLAVPGPGGTQVMVPAMMSASMPDGQTIRPMRGQTVGEPLVRGQPSQNNAGSVSYELINLAAGRYMVTTMGEEGEQGQTMQTVELVNGATLSLDDAAAPASVSGRMIFDTPRPPGELNVRLNGMRRTIPVPVAVDGTFKVGKIIPGSYNLFQDSNAIRITELEAKGVKMVRDRLELTPGAVAEVTIHAQSVEALATVKGFAMQNDKGVGGAMVLLLPQDLSRVRLIRRYQSDADGSFSLLNVQPGNYIVVAIDDGDNLAYKDDKVIRPFLAGGVAVTVPVKTEDPVKVSVQNRKE